MKHSVLLIHPQGMCLCGSRTLTWHSSSAQGLTHFWEAQAPYLASPAGERLQVLARGKEQWEETGAQPPEEGRDDGLMG